MANIQFDDSFDVIPLLKPTKPNCKRRRSFILLNMLLFILLVLASLYLLLMILPDRFTRASFCPIQSRYCFWPFKHHSHHTVLLISMDGFRHDYLELIRKRLGPDALPNFARLQSKGARPNRSINAFPTVTLPNHQTLITGLYPQDNGIIGNSILDRSKPNDSFSMGNQFSLNEAPWLENWPEPVWVTVQRAGRLVGSLLWPLTDGPVHGDLPFQQVSQFTQLNSFNVRYAYTKRVNDLLWWLDNPRYKLDLILAYFDEPDESGHANGPHSDQVTQAVAQLDVALGQLLDGLDKRGLTDHVDIILTADHGMTNISSNQVIPLDPLISLNDYQHTLLSTVGLIYPKEGKTEELYKKLHGAHPHLKVHHRHEVPEDLYFNRNTSRMPDLILLPDPGWYLVHHENVSVVRGDHGYTPNFTDMNPFLIASGPSFKRVGLLDKVIVHAVDIYPLICGLLRVHAQPHNGSLERILPLVRPEVADQLRRLDQWPRWLVWLTVEIELTWILINIAIILMIFTLLVITMRVQRGFFERERQKCCAPVMHVRETSSQNSSVVC